MTAFASLLQKTLWLTRPKLPTNWPFYVSPTTPGLNKIYQYLLSYIHRKYALWICKGICYTFKQDSEDMKQ